MVQLPTYMHPRQEQDDHCDAGCEEEGTKPIVKLVQEM